MNVMQNESRNEGFFSSSMDKRPMSESADSLINTSGHNNCYLTDNLQTLVSKRMSYLLRHAAAAEKVAMTPQGYVDIADIIKWLQYDIKVQVTMTDITHIAQHNLKAR